MKQVSFDCVVRENKGIFKTGRINSLELVPFIGKRVVVTIKEVGLNGA